MLTLKSFFCPEAAESFLQTIVLGMLAMHSHTFPPGVGMISRVILLGMLGKHSQFHSTGGNIFSRMNPLVNLWVHSHVYPPGGSIVRTEDNIWDACGDAEDAFSRLSTRWWHFDTTRFYWLCWQWKLMCVKQAPELFYRVISLEMLSMVLYLSAGLNSPLVNIRNVLEVPSHAFPPGGRIFPQSTLTEDAGKASPPFFYSCLHFPSTVPFWGNWQCVLALKHEMAAFFHQRFCLRCWQCFPTFV